MGNKGGSKPKVSEQERALAERGAREFNDYVQRYIPAEDAFLDKTKATPEREAAQRGIAQADAAMSHAQARKKLGAKPGSGRAVMARNTLQDAMGSAGAAGQAIAGQGVHDRELAAETKMTAFGRGLADQSSVNLRDSGRRAQEASINKFDRAQANSRSLISSAATLGGLGIQYGKAKQLDKKDGGNRAEDLFFGLGD